MANQSGRISFKEAAKQVLQSADEPLSAAEITLTALERGLIATEGHFSKAKVVRRLSPLPGSALIYERLLDLLNVDFVRAASPTVMPFPFKLLREYRQMATKPVSAFGALDLDLDG